MARLEWFILKYESGVEKQRVPGVFRNLVYRRRRMGVFGGEEIGTFGMMVHRPQGIETIIYSVFQIFWKSSNPEDIDPGQHVCEPSYKFYCKIFKCLAIKNYRCP